MNNLPNHTEQRDKLWFEINERNTSNKKGRIIILKSVLKHILTANTEPENVLCDDCGSVMRLYEHQGVDGDSMEYYICDRCESMVDLANTEPEDDDIEKWRDKFNALRNVADWETQLPSHAKFNMQAIENYKAWLQEDK